mgnify:CR=1 FL=1
MQVFDSRLNEEWSGILEQVRRARSRRLAELLLPQILYISYFVYLACRILLQAL